MAGVTPLVREESGPERSRSSARMRQPRLCKKSNNQRRREESGARQGLTRSREKNSKPTGIVQRDLKVIIYGISYFYIGN